MVRVRGVQCRSLRRSLHGRCAPVEPKFFQERSMMEVAANHRRNARSGCARRACPADRAWQVRPDRGACCRRYQHVCRRDRPSPALQGRAAVCRDSFGSPASVRRSAAAHRWRRSIAIGRIRKARVPRSRVSCGQRPEPLRVKRVRSVRSEWCGLVPCVARVYGTRAR